MAAKFLPTVETLRKLFDYDPDLGIILHRECENKIQGRMVGSKRKEVFVGEYERSGMPAELTYAQGKYLQVIVHGTRYPAHRVAWALYYGEWPKGSLDHINRDKHDNRIDNLRLATAAQNARNTTSRQNSTSKYLGVSAFRGKWRASIGSGGQVMQLGDFDDEKDAALAYDCAAVMLHREFAAPNLIENPYLTRKRK